MKRKPAWYVVGLLIIGLALLAFSCGHTAPTAMAHAPEAMGDDCAMCHKVGGAGVGETGGTGIADTHEGRTSDICLDCHEE